MIKSTVDVEKQVFRMVIEDITYTIFFLLLICFIKHPSFTMKEEALLVAAKYFAALSINFHQRVESAGAAQAIWCNKNQ